MTTEGERKGGNRPDWRTSRLKRFEAAAIGAIGYPLMAGLGRTWRWQVSGAGHLDAVQASGRQPIFALWHGRILPSVVYFRDRGIVAITSENFDGEWIARIMRRFGYAAARGSSSRGGSRALIQLRRDMAAGRPAAFTVDGPRGPARHAQAGAVWLAKATGHPVVPFHIEADRRWELPSWDRGQVPRPWSRVALAIGAPLEVPAVAGEAGIEAARSELERRLVELEGEALALLGRL